MINYNIWNTPYLQGMTQLAMRSLPVLLVLFLFGCKKDASQEVLIEKDFCASIHRNDETSLSLELQRVADQLRNKSGVYVMEDGGGSLVTRAWLTEYAERTIDIQYFIFSTDNVGLIACDYLVRAADRGVKIRILVDDIMVEADESDLLTLDLHPNIDIRIYNPGVNIGKNIFAKIKKFATEFRLANQRMHNKTFIVDKSVAITGGRNVADEYFDYDHDYNFRDRDVLLLGNVVDDIDASFDLFWKDALSVPVSDLIEDKSGISYHDSIYHALHQYACNPANFWPQIRTQIENLPKAFDHIIAENRLFWLDSVYFVSDDVEKNEATKGLGGGGRTTDVLIDLVKNANRSIDIQSPYLVTTELSRKLFKAAVDRGVKVRILTNSLASTDNLEAFSGYQRDRKALLETGVEVYEFRPDAAVRKEVMTGDLQKELDFMPIFGLHSKTMVVDDHITVIGTFNLDPRSANLNTECLAIMYSDEIARGVMVGIEEEFKPENAWRTTIHSNPDSLVSRKKRIKTWTRKVVPKGIL